MSDDRKGPTGPRPHPVGPGPLPLSRTHMIICPECRKPSPSTANRCPCGFPLVFVSSPPQQAAIDPGLFVTPGESSQPDDTVSIASSQPTQDLQIVPWDRDPTHNRKHEEGKICPSCRRENPKGREQWCAWCAAPLQSPRPSTEATPTWPTPLPRRRWPRALIAIGAVTMGALILVWAMTGHRPFGPTPNPTPTLIDRARITAAASSTLVSDASTYDVVNTLDGREDTAWNSAGAGVGVTLTYRFDEAVDLRSITIRNGYVRSPRSATVYTDNRRLKLVTIRTDSGDTSWTLRDTKAAQSLSMAFGRTTGVTIIVRSVYPGAKYKDLAMTDITFTGID